MNEIIGTIVAIIVLGGFFVGMSVIVGLDPRVGPLAVFASWIMLRLIRYVIRHVDEAKSGSRN